MSLHNPPPESTPLSTLFSLANKRCLITGGNRGIGFAVSQAFAEAGASHIAIIHSSAAGSQCATKAVQELLAAYPTTLQRIVAYVADVSRATQIESVMVQVAQDFGGLDVCVVNAGVYCDGPILEKNIPADESEEEVRTVGGVNWEGAVYTARAAAR